MRYISTTGDAVPALVRWDGPNLLCFTRAARPPVASLIADDDDDDEKEEADSCEESASANKSELRGMSAQSALRLARVLSTIEWRRLGRCIHVTLTYWRTWPRSKKELHDAKNAIGTWFSRYVEAGIWRLEYQSRKKPRPHKVPHWHLLVWCGDADLVALERRIRVWWVRYSGNTSDFGVHVTSGDQARGTWYLAMHAAKREQSPPFRVGRWWGYINRKRLLGAQDLNRFGEVLERERVWWTRLYKRATGARVRNQGGFSWFLPRAAQSHAYAWIQQHISEERAATFRPPDPF